jgi:dihydropteroate synthase
MLLTISNNVTEAAPLVRTNSREVSSMSISARLATARHNSASNMGLSYQIRSNISAGIIQDITPDSFSDGGLFVDTATALAHAGEMIAAGAALIDVGAESTKPNATALSWEQEWGRLEPVLKPLLEQYPMQISVDSYHAETIEQALRIGPIIVNDVSGMNNPAMVAVVAKYKPNIIISHLPGQSIPDAHAHAPVGDSNQVRRELLVCARELEYLGMPHDRIILDPGIGFGKTMALNHELLTFASLIPDYPVMIGYSRKRFLGETRMELAPNLAAGRIAIDAGAVYLRVHDVAGHAVLLHRAQL